ncbi:uncharacterized protein [Arachis hypogaea]|uniref:uncharacterized protein n=1 Tax=Arachis hypogaea TaxID=3818 RepID=UPI003B211A06
MIRTGLVKRILVGTGADSNIMFRNVFNALGLKEIDLRTHQHGVVGLGDNYIRPDGIITLPIYGGFGESKRSMMAEFVVLRDSATYNVILGRKTINEFPAVIYTKFLTVKFLRDSEAIGSIQRDLEMMVACDNASLSLKKKSKEAVGVFLADLDARVDDKPSPEPHGDLEKFWEPLIEVIKANDDLFTWIPSEMPGVDPDFMSHCLAVKPNAKPLAQQQRKMSSERYNEVARQTISLLEADFIKELEYSTWLSNVVLVKKATRK